MFKSGQILGRCVLLLAACFCLFTLVQIARPLESTILRCRPQIAAKHHKLTRYALEEVDSQGSPVSAHSALESSYFLPRPIPQRPRVKQVDARDWTLPYLPVQRRILPPAPDDAH